MIGSYVYVDDINKSQEKLAEADAVVSQKMNALKYVEKEKESLVGAKTEAEEFLAKDCKILEKKNILCQIRRKDCLAKCKELETSMSHLAEEKEQHQSIVEQLEKALKEIETTFEEANSDYEVGNLVKEPLMLWQAMGKELTETKKKFSAAERQDVKLREDVKHAKTKQKKLKAQIQRECKKIKEAEAAIAMLENDIAKNKAQV